MSTNLIWKIPQEGKDLSSELKFAFREILCDGESVRNHSIDCNDINLLQAIAYNNQSKTITTEINRLIKAIEKHGLITLNEVG